MIINVTYFRVPGKWVKARNEQGRANWIHNLAFEADLFASLVATSAKYPLMSARLRRVTT